MFTPAVPGLADPVSLLQTYCRLLDSGARHYDPHPDIHQTHIPAQRSVALPGGVDEPGPGEELPGVHRRVPTAGTATDYVRGLWLDQHHSICWDENGRKQRKG